MDGTGIGRGSGRRVGLICSLAVGAIAPPVFYVARLLRGFFQRRSQGCARTRVETGAGVLDAEHPAIGIVFPAVSPTHGDASLRRVLQCVDQQILSDTPCLDGITFDL